MHVRAQRAHGKLGAGTMVTGDITWFVLAAGICVQRWSRGEDGLNSTQLTADAVPLPWKQMVQLGVACIRNVMHVVYTKLGSCGVCNFSKDVESGKPHCGGTWFAIRAVPPSLCTKRCSKPWVWVTRTKLTSSSLSSSNAAWHGLFLICTSQSAGSEVPLKPSPGVEQGSSLLPPLILSSQCNQWARAQLLQNRSREADLPSPMQGCWVSADCFAVSC